MSCLMALSLLVLQSPTAVKGQQWPDSPPPILPEFQTPSPLYPTIPVTPWPPTGQCPLVWHGFYSDPNDMGYPIPQGNCLDGEWRDNSTITEEVFIPMRDGVQLAANVFRPGKPGKYPVIMTFSGYGKDVFGTGKGWGVDSNRYSDHTTFEGPDPGFFVPEGYVVVVVDPRGSDKSHGCRRGGPDALDYYDATEWAGTQAWSNGNVGSIGVSALGMFSWQAGALRPPHLKAVSPWESTPELNFSNLPTPMFGGLTDWGFGATIRASSSTPYPDSDKCKGYVPPNAIPLVLENITVPVLACVSSSDQFVHTRGTEWGWRHVSSRHKWIYNHGGQKWGRFYGTDGQAFQKMFFDHFLKGTDSRILETPRVRIEVRDTLDKYEVRYEDDWPIPRTQYRKLYLDAVTGTIDFDQVDRTGKISYDSTVTEVAITDTSAFNDTRYEPSVLNETSSTWNAPGRAVFDYTFDKDTELSGHMALKVWVSADSSTDMALFVTVKKLDVNGNEVFFDCSDSPGRLPVALGWLKLSMRDLDPVLSTPWQPIQSLKVDPVLPGEIVPAEIEIISSSTLFHAGETLRLIISGDTQVFNTRHHFVHFNHGTCSIYTGGQYDSYLLVPVVPPRTITEVTVTNE
ncbi:MAG: CocE/NonD family hydrolase [Thermodesulfobacteriota bacterium]